MSYMELGTVESAEESAHGRLAEIDRLGEIILRHGYDKLLGVTLLHRHYDIEKNEVLLTEVVDGCLLSKPSTRFTGGIIERRWLWSPKVKDWMPYEYIAEAVMVDELPEIAKLRVDSSFWCELGQAIDSFGLASLFGLTLHDPRSREIPAEMALLEVNAAHTRRTIVCQVPSGSVGPIEAGVTVWNFFEVIGEKRPSGKCAHGNSQHCCGNIERAKDLLISLAAPAHLLDAIPAA